MECDWPNCPRYFRNNYENLKTKFAGAENIENNWSQSMQDIFVMSMLDGKRNGEADDDGVGGVGECYPKTGDWLFTDSSATCRLV